METLIYVLMDKNVPENDPYNRFVNCAYETLESAQDAIFNLSFYNSSEHLEIVKMKKEEIPSFIDIYE